MKCNKCGYDWSNSGDSAHVCGPVKVKQQEQSTECVSGSVGEPFEYWNAVEGWVKLDEIRDHFDSVSCATIYKNGGEGRVPLCLAQPKQEQGEPDDLMIAYMSGLHDGKKLAKQEQDEPWLLESTQEVAKAMAKEFYPEVTQWKVLDDLAGVISQIDNMTTGLIRKPKQEQSTECVGEPVAWLCEPDENGMYGLPLSEGACTKCFPVYRSPQQRKPLTDEQIERIWESLPFCNGAWETFARAIEAAHGIKD